MIFVWKLIPRFGFILFVMLLYFRLYEVRGRLYELLSHCIPADVIMKV